MTRRRMTAAGRLLSHDARAFAHNCASRDPANPVIAQAEDKLGREYADPEPTFPATDHASLANRPQIEFEGLPIAVEQIAE
jgi:hypothetical protein